MLRLFNYHFHSSSGLLSQKSQIQFLYESFAAACDLLAWWRQIFRMKLSPIVDIETYRRW